MAQESAGGHVTLTVIQTHFSGNQAAQEISGSNLQFPPSPSSRAGINAGKVSAKPPVPQAGVNPMFSLPCPVSKGTQRRGWTHWPWERHFSALISNNVNQAFNNILIPDVLSRWPTVSTQNSSNLYPNAWKQVASLENSIWKQHPSLPTQQGRAVGQQEHHHPAASSSSLPLILPGRAELQFHRHLIPDTPEPGLSSISLGSQLHSAPTRGS